MSQTSFSFRRSFYLLPLCLCFLEVTPNSANLVSNAKGRDQPRAHLIPASQFCLPNLSVSLGLSNTPTLQHTRQLSGQEIKEMNECEKVVVS